MTQVLPSPAANAADRRARCARHAPRCRRLDGRLRLLRAREMPRETLDRRVAEQIEQCQGGDDLAQTRVRAQHQQRVAAELEERIGTPTAAAEARRARRRRWLRLGGRGGGRVHARGSTPRARQQLTVDLAVR